MSTTQHCVDAFTTTWTFLGMTAGDWSNIIGAVLAAVVAVVVAVIAYVGQKRRAREQHRRTIYAEALRAVEDYLEAPYLIRRRDGSVQARHDLVRQISDIQSRLNFYCAWLELHAEPEVHQAFVAYVAAARTEAGGQMTAAWSSRPTRRDRDVPIGEAYARPHSDAARRTVLELMKGTR